jgi:hypothetical protein
VPLKVQVLPKLATAIWAAMATAEACLYGQPLRFPVDLSSRASRRACLEPRFPGQLGKDSILLKDTPIQLCWGSRSPTKQSDKGVSIQGSPEKKTVAERPAWDPHRVGFGPIPSKFRNPPGMKDANSILGEIPSSGRRGAGCVVEEGGEHYHGGDDIGGEFPPLSQ